MKRHLDFLVGVPLIFLLKLFKGKNRPPPDSVRKILVVKLAAAGDTVLMIPFLRALRERFPSAEIHWLVSSVNYPIAKTVPFVDRLWLLSSFDWKTIKQMKNDLSSRQFDVIIDLEQWARGTALLAHWIGARFLTGFQTPGQYKHGLFDEAVPKSFDHHERDEFLRLLNWCGMSSPSGDLELWETRDGKREWAQKVPEPWKTAPFKVLLHPGCGQDGGPREWPLSNYAVLGHWLMVHYGAAIFISGGPDEKQKGDALHRLLNKKSLNLAGGLSWEGTLTLVNKMDLVLSGNTGIMHIAAAFGKKQVALHGPTDPKIWGPLNKNARILQTSCPNCPSLKLGFEYHRNSRDCMAKIAVHDVKDALKSLIDNEGCI